MELRERIERAVACEREGRLDEALRAWIEVARLDPASPRAYERLFELHVHRREVDAAFCAASVLASLEALDGTARELYEDYVPRRLPPRVRGASLDADDWAVLRHPEEDLALGARLAALLPKFKLKPAGWGAIDMGTLAWAAEALGASAAELPRDGAPPLVACADLDEVWGNYTLRERLFFAGRVATDLRAPAHRLLEVATIREISEALGVSAADVKRCTVGMELTQARAGMLVCGEPLVVRQLLVREHADEATLGELALFAVSPEHHRLRAKLGVAIGVAADAPDEPAPAPLPVSTPAPPPAPSTRLSAETIVRALLDPALPPSTVGELLDALGIELDASVVAASAGGTILLAPHVVDWVSEQQLAIRAAVDPRPESAPPTEAWLRERRIVAFSLVCADGAAIEAALRARFAPGPVLLGDQGDDYHAFGRWVHTLRSGVLGWFERSPEWLSAPADADARRAALRALLEGLPRAATMADLADVVARLPTSGGVVRRGEDARDAIELAFAPPIPAKLLWRALALQGVVAERSAEQWVLRRISSRDEPGPTMPLQLGSWSLAPQLAEPPTAGVLEKNSELHLCHAIDVVVSMRIARTAPAPLATDQPRPFSGSEWYERAEAARAKELAEAERAALASGKQLFDYGYLKGTRVGDESTARLIYYLLKPELRTLDEFIAYLDESAVWDQR